MSHGLHRRVLSRRALLDMADRYRTEAAHLSSDLIDVMARNALLQQENDQLKAQALTRARDSVDAPGEGGRQQ